MMDQDILFPGDTLGIIGGSPSGIMLARAAKQMGFKVVIYCSDESNPLLEEANVKIVGKLNEKTKLQDFAQRCDVVTYTSEHIDVEAVKFLSQFTRVPQGSNTLEITQDRLLERAFFEQLNINVAPYATIVSLDDVYQAVGSIGYPCILKPIQKGFGKHRKQVIKKQTDIAKCADIIDLGTYVLESWIPYEKELSLTLARDKDGHVSFFPIAEDIYRDHRLHATIVPTDIADDVKEEVERLTTEIVKEIDYVGVLQAEYFLTESGALYIKRIIPALYASGYAFDKATNISMFEQHLRALGQLPLGHPKLVRPTEMVMIETKDLDALRTQWVLKDNWHFNYFRYPESLKPVSAEGYLLVTAALSKNARQQVEATGIWDDQVGKAKSSVTEE